MIPYLHILIRVEGDGSLHALGAFTSKERLEAYQEASALEEDQVRLDFHNGPFEEEIQVIYAAHRRWNQNSYQQAGYFLTEGEAWNLVTEEGYVSVLRIDTSFEEEQKLQEEALALYAKLQKRWRLTSYEDLVARQGAEKARADIKLRFYQDALESFKPKTKRDVRALYALGLGIVLLFFAYSFYQKSNPEYETNVPYVEWLPRTCSNVSYYRSKQVEVYEFNISPKDFVNWVESMGMEAERITSKQVISRYTAYIPTNDRADEPSVPEGRAMTEDEFRKMQNAISATVRFGMYATGESKTAVFDGERNRAYFEQMSRF